MKTKSIIFASFIMLTFVGCFSVSPTQRAVMFYPYGRGLVKDATVLPGVHLKAPWNTAIKFSVNESTIKETLDVLDKNGLSLKVEMSTRFAPQSDKIGYIYEKFTSDYVEVLVQPEVRSTVRQVMGRYTAEEIYSTRRAEVEATIKKETELKLVESHINATAVLIRSIVLPDKIKASIERKLQQEQEFLAYKFRIDKEKSEAERKTIAAQGEARANAIINSSLTKELLTMRGIEATIELAKSPNSKVIVVGGTNGLPMILGN